MLNLLALTQKFAKISRFDTKVGLIKIEENCCSTTSLY